MTSRCCVLRVWMRVTSAWGLQASSPPELRRRVVGRIQAEGLTSPCDVSGTSSLCYLAPTSEVGLAKLIRPCPNKTCMPSEPAYWYFGTDPQHSLASFGPDCELLLALGRFPDSLKAAVLRPLLKDPALDRNNMSNYRSVSTLPFISKVLEKAAMKRLVEHLDFCNLHE